MDEIQKRVIKYCSFEMKGFDFANKYKIKDEKNLTYSFFDTKKNGDQTKAYQQWQDLKPGQNVEVAFKEEQGTYQGKPVTYRTALYFAEAGNVEAPTQAPVDDEWKNEVNAKLRILQSQFPDIKWEDAIQVDIAGEIVHAKTVDNSDIKEEEIVDNIPF